MFKVAYERWLHGEQEMTLLGGVVLVGVDDGLDAVAHLERGQDVPGVGLDGASDSTSRCAISLWNRPL